MGGEGRFEAATQERASSERASGERLLRPLTPAVAEHIEHWFDHPEVRRRLGGRSWIHRAVRLTAQTPGSTFRGKTVLRSYGWVALDEEGAPVSFVGGDVYDRWVRFRGDGNDGVVLTDEDPRRSMGLSYVVDPARWRLGHGLATLRTVVAHPEVEDVELFFCGIDADNYASQRCAMSAGFQPLDPVPDSEDMLYFRYERRGTPDLSG